MRLPWLSLALLTILLVLSPFAMSLPPYPSHTTDLLYPYRLTLVLLGVSTTVMSLIEFTVVLRRTSLEILAVRGAAFLACAVIGWRSYPYWANGVYQAATGAFPWMDQDPSGLIPMLWLHETWPLSVLLLYMLCWIGVPVLFAAIVVALRRRQFIPAGVTALCTGLVLVFMVGFSPDYVAWLMD